MKYSGSAIAGVTPKSDKSPSFRLILISVLVVVGSILVGCSTADNNNNRVGLRPTTGLGFGYFGGGGGGSFVGSGVGVGIGIGGSSGRRIDKKATRKQTQEES